MFEGQSTFGLGRLEKHDRRFIEWKVMEIFELRKEYVTLCDKIKWLTVLYPKRDINPIIDDLICVSDQLWYLYALIYRWLCHIDMEVVWAELGYDLFHESET